MAPLALDFLQRIINVHWGDEIDQQGLVASYPLLESGSIGDPTASALDSGDTFPDVASGASGLGFTVLTKGLVCFGTPRDGVSCFMAVPDYDIASGWETSSIIKRGALDENDNLTWESVGGDSGLVALTFAGGAFHAVYLEGGLGSEGTRIDTSFDGKTWTTAHAFPSDVLGGAVAYNGSSYAAAGLTTTDTANDSDPVYIKDYRNLAWVTASVPPPDDDDPGTSLSWTSGQTEEIDANPGADTGAERITFNGTCTVAGGRIGEGTNAENIFVAATYDKIKIIVDLRTSSSAPSVNRQVVLQTAAAATSSDGDSWTNSVLSGVVEGYITLKSDGKPADTFGASYGTAAVYVRRKEGSGYFLCTAASRTTGPGINETSLYSTLHKSEDGTSWSVLRQEDNQYFFVLSAIAKDLSKTEIVHL